MGHKWQDPYPYWNSNAHSPLKETVKVWSISFFFILYIIRLLFFFFPFRFWSTSLLLWPSNGNALEDSHTRLKSFESFALPLVAIGFFLLLFHDMDHYTFNIFSQAYSNGTKLFFPLMAVSPHARGNEYKNWLAHDMTITRKWDHCTYLY